MRPHRGLTIKEGEWVYGGLYECDGRAFILQKKPVYHLIFYAVKWKGFEVSFIEVIPESVGQFVCTDKHGEEVYRGDLTNKGYVIAAFKYWVWTYTKDPTTYHWHINISADIELIEDKEDE